MNNVAMHDPLLLEILISSYFSIHEIEDKEALESSKDRPILTVPGFALAIGFSSTGDIISTLKAYRENMSPYPEESILFMLRALTRLEDYYVQNGLRDRFPSAIVKLCLSHYHDVSDKSESIKSINSNANILVVFSDDKKASLPNYQQKLDMEGQPVIELSSQ